MDWLDDLFFPPPTEQWLKNITHPLGTLPVVEINQTWLNAYRECHRKGLLFAEFERGKSSYYMFAGSVFHVAVDEAISSPDIDRWLHRSRDQKYWMQVFEKVWAFNPQETYDSEINLDLFLKNLVGTDKLDGMYVGQLIYFAVQMLRAGGFEILETELNMRLLIPGGTPFTGTMDMLLFHKQIGLIIADTKTSGLMGIFVKMSSIAKQSYSEDQVANHLQLTHYGWQGWRLGRWQPHEIKKHMIFTPANLTKYVKGENKGQLRGPPFHWGDPITRNIERYEEDLILWLNMARDGHFARLYPTMFGKLTCDRCPYHKHCYGDKKSEYVPDYLRDME